MTDFSIDDFFQQQVVPELSLNFECKYNRTCLTGTRFKNINLNFNSESSNLIKLIMTNNKIIDFNSSLMMKYDHGKTLFCLADIFQDYTMYYLSSLLLILLLFTIQTAILHAYLFNCTGIAT